MNIKEHIILETDDFVAVNKPADMLTIPDREGNISVKNYLQQLYGSIYTVHRIDRDTSGLVIFARNEPTHKQLSQLFESRDIEKYYLGLVQGKPSPPGGTIDEPIAEHSGKKGVMVINKRGKASVTDYQTLQNFRSYSWMQFQIHTGRTHQIRIHMKHIGHPIVCDDIYGDGKPVYISTIKRKYNLSKSQEEERPILSRLALHSWKLHFILNDKEYSIEADIPKDLKALLQQLKKWSV